MELETNGSLFNEKNWSYISNLGQYHLSVSITVLSFSRGYLVSRTLRNNIADFQI